MKTVYPNYEELNNTLVYDPSDFILDQLQSKMVQINDEIEVNIYGNKLKFNNEVT